jgi:hypothetical protein
VIAVFDAPFFAKILPSRRRTVRIIGQARRQTNMTDSHLTLRLPTLVLVLCVGVIIVSGSAAAQTPEQQAPANGSVLDKIGHWFSQSFTAMGDQFKSARNNVDSFNQQAARVTADAAASAADAVAKIPKTRIVSGHQNCAIADNGAPDCRSAAEHLCKAQGMASGKSLDITAAEECPVRVVAGARQAQPGECKNVTFVTRAVCQ